jgi:hypothetical protein
MKKITKESFDKLKLFYLVLSRNELIKVLGGTVSKKAIIILLIMSFLTGFSGIAQERTRDTIKTWNISFDEDTDPRPALERALDTMRVSMNLPEYLNASQNKYLIYPYDEASPNIAQQYGRESASGDTAFNLQFELFHSIIKHQNDNYVIFVYAGGEVNVKLGNVIENLNPIFNVINPSFNRIKHDLHYGTRHKSATVEEIAVLDTIITHYPQETAQELFNADWLVSYPKDLRGEVYEGKYSQCRAVAVAKNGLDIYLYFMMTDETVKNFDSYLQDFKKVFWYMDNE